MDTFPVILPVFTVALIFGENEVSDEILFESLLLYRNQSDRDLITAALKEDFFDEDRDEPLDLLDRLDATTLPIQSNLKALLLKVAHKQLIQKPRYAADNVSLVASHFLKEAFVRPQEMYEDKKKKAFEVDASISQNRFLQQYTQGLCDCCLLNRHEAKPKVLKSHQYAPLMHITYGFSLSMCHIKLGPGLMYTVREKIIRFP